MRRVWTLSLAMVLALPARAEPAATAPDTILVVPFARLAGTPEWASVAVSEGLTELVAQAGRDNFLTLKQLDAVLRRRDLRVSEVADPAVALPVARALGATDVVTGELRRVDDRYFLRARRVSVATKRTLKAVHEEVAAKDLPSVPSRLAAALLGLAPPLPPITADAAAFEALGRCALLVVRQPLGPRAPAVLPLAEAAAAEVACRAALERDPSLGLASAGLAVVAAAKGELDRARSLAREARRTRPVPLAFLVESYAARRQGDAAAARALLDAAVAAHPGFLHALGYLGEDRLDARDAAGALAAFDRYLARAPGHPWALSMKAKALERLGRGEEALAASRDALSKSPSDPELLIAHAGRLLGAGRAAEAEAPLREALGAWPVRPAAHLRLGTVYLRLERAALAKEHLTKAVLEAWREDEARTRGLAHARLARVAGLEGDVEAAIAHLEAARAEGSPRRLPCDAPELAAFRGRPAFERACGGAK